MRRAATLLSMVLVAAAVCATAVSGCSPISNETAIQCTSEAECLSLGPAFAGTTCDRTTRTCIKVAADQDLCSRNQQCIDKAGGLPAICRKRDRKCVTLQTPECPTVMQQPGQLLDDNAIVIGALTPAAHTELGDNMEAAMALAQADLATQVRGLPSTDGSSSVRPLVIVACREFNAGGFDSLTRAADHLARDIGVPINIGPVDPANANFVATQVFIPNRVLTLLPTGISSGLAALPNPIAPTPLLWSTSFTDDGTTTAAQELIVKDLEPKLRAEGVTGPLRVALMLEDNFFGQNGALLMEQKLRFNGGKTAAENERDNNYLRVNIGNLIDPIGNPAPEAKVAQAVGAVAAFKPHIVLHSYAPAAIPPTFFSLVFAWPPSVKHAYHVDLLSTFGAFAPLLEILNLVPPLRTRVFSVATRLPPELTPRIDQWVIKFKSEFPQFRTSRTPETSIVHVWYDTTYLAAYAIVANGAKPLTGENVAGTLSRSLPPGQLVRTGTEDITKAFGVLNSGAGIDITGLSGAMDLDPRTGFPSYGVEMTCPGADEKGTIVRFKNSGFYTENGNGVGTPSCGGP